MSEQTDFLKLIKPGYADPADIKVINGNMDILDANAAAVVEAIEELENSKAAKASLAVAGNLVGQDGDGNLVDAGVNKFELLNLRGGNMLAVGTDIHTLAPGTYWAMGGDTTTSLINAPANRLNARAQVIISSANGALDNNDWLYAEFIQHGGAWFAYKEAENWSGWMEKTYTYTTLASMKLSDAGLSSTDFGANVLAMINATVSRGVIRMYLYEENEPNLVKSIKAYLNTTDIYYDFELRRSENSSRPNPFFITPNGTGALMPLYYGTYDNYLSPPAILNAGNRKNLWRNSDFRKPVNTRGQLFYNETVKHTIDNLFINTGAGQSGMNVTVNDGFITIGNSAATNGFVTSFIEDWQDLRGETVTVSIMDTDGIVYSATGTFPDVWTSENVTITTNTPWGYIRVQYVNSRPTVWCVININSGQSKSFLRGKLELNPFSTLPWDPPQNYGRTERDCQRYTFKNTNEVSEFIRAAHMTTDIIYFDMPTPVTMRKNPTIASYTQLDVWAFGATGPETGFTFTAVANNGSIRVGATKVGHGLTDATLRANGVLFDADNY